jgi:hypothetical protein
MDDEIEDEDLLMEAARYAIKVNCSRNRFMSLAKRAWYHAAMEAGQEVPGIRILVSKK